MSSIQLSSTAISVTHSYAEESIGGMSVIAGGRSDVAFSVVAEEDIAVGLAARSDEAS